MSERPEQHPHPHPPLPCDAPLPAGDEHAGPPSLRTRAAGWLLFASALWGLSFPFSKTLYLAQTRLLPGVDTWFLAAVSLVVRFGLAAGVLTLSARRTLPQLTRAEFSQGLGLGLFAGGGMLLQMDGINYTAASTSAFLTSCYCVIIPVIVACRRRRWPRARVAGSCALVVLGMAILTGVTPRALHLGRGEWETLLASAFFAGQIFWLERPRYACNRTSHATAMMFATLAVAALPVMLARCRAGGEIVVAATGSASIMVLLLTLTLACTLVTFTLMNHWQRHIEATEAGLIYCAEPVWTSVAALFLPGWLAMLAGVVYPDETATWQLLLGGALITAANVAVQVKPARTVGGNGVCRDMSGAIEARLGGRNPAFVGLWRTRHPPDKRFSSSNHVALVPFRTVDQAGLFC